MLHPLRLPDCAARLTWIVELQGHIIRALCDPACRSDQINDAQWVVDLFTSEGLGLEDIWVKRFCGWQHEKSSLLDRMKLIAGFSAEVKALILAAFENDIQIALIYPQNAADIHNPIGLSNINHLSEAVQNTVHLFFESFYDPALYTGYRIPNGALFINFDRKIYLKEFSKINPDVQVCPVCDGDLGSPKVDHYFPKALYPYLSCHPMNLVPICDDCNGPGGKHEKLPLTLGAGDQAIDWFHPFLRSAHRTSYRVSFVQEGENLIPTLENDDAQNQRRLDNLSNLVNLRPRWRDALSRKTRAIQRKIENEKRRRGHSLSDEELLEKIEQWGDSQECEIGLEPFAILESAYLQSVSRREAITFDELLAVANKELDVVSLGL